MYTNKKRRELENLLKPLLAVNKPLKDSNLLKAYATFVVVRHEMDCSGVECNIAYNCLYQNPKKHIAMLPVRHECTNNEFRRAMDAFLQIPLEDFLRYIVPEMVTNKKEILQIYRRHRNDILWLTYQIIQVKMTYYSYANIKPKKQGEQRQLFPDSSDSAPSEAEYLVQPLYEQYCDLVPVEEQVPRNEFVSIYAATVLYKLDNSELFRRSKVNYSEKELKKLTKLLLEDLEMTRPEAVSFCKSFFVDNRQASDQVRNQVLRKFMRKKAPLVREELLTDAIMLMAKMTPMDVLCQIAITKCGSRVYEEPVVPNDVALENGLIFDCFLSKLPPCEPPFDAEQESVVVLFPTVFFVRKCVKDNELNRSLQGRNLTFVFEDEALYSLIELHYQSGPYDVEPANMSFATLEEWSKAIQSKGATGRQRILAFFTRATLQQQNDIFMTLSALALPLEIDALLASHEFESAKSPFSRELNDSRFYIHDIELIPQGINNATEPRRKILLHITFDPAGQTVVKQTAITAFTLNTDLKTQSLSRTREDPVLTEQRTLEVLDGTIRQVYLDELLTRKASGRQKAAPISYDFTPDLHIWCNKNYPEGNYGRPRLEAYFAPMAPPEKLQRGYMPRDNAIEGTKKRTTRFYDNEIEHWLEAIYPFSELHHRVSRASTQSDFVEEGERLQAVSTNSAVEPEPEMPRITYIREQAIAAFTPILKGENIAIKTYWYLYPCLMDLFSAREKHIFEEMAVSEIGRFRIRDLTLEGCEQLLMQYYPDEDQEQLLQRLRILSTVLSQAVTDGYCTENPLQEAIRKEQELDKLFAQVRRARTNKHFDCDQFRCAYQIAVNEFQQGGLEYLGVILRLVTGLDSNTLCGLMWKDVVSVTDYQMLKLVITRQVTNDGSMYQGFSSLEDYLIFPCTPLLQRHLEKMRRCVKDTVKDGYGYLELPVVTSREQLEDPSLRMRAFRPRNLDKLCREIQNAVGIEDYLVTIPTHGAGTKETNLNQYGGDFFRENFRYWALNVALTADETMYLMGNKPVTTFGRFYCDFLNDVSQLAMQVKLRRLDALILTGDASQDVAHEECIDPTKYYLRSFEAKGGAMNLSLKLAVEDLPETLHVEVECENGCSIYAAPLTKK